MLGHTKKLNPINICTGKAIHEENSLKNSFCWCLEPNLEQESICIKIPYKYDTLPYSSQSGVDFQQIQNYSECDLSPCLYHESLYKP